MSNYVSLHNHTSFSLMDSLIDPPDLFKTAKELGQKAVAVTDHGTIAGAWDCLKQSKKTGVKLIIGCEFYFVNDVENKDEKLKHIILLAKNAQGYRNLLCLSNAGFDNLIVAGNNHVYSRIDWKLLEEFGEGLICSTACVRGVVAYYISQKQHDEAKKVASKLKDIFGDNLALEVQPHAMKRPANIYDEPTDQAYINNKIIELGKELQIKVIAATNAHYIKKEDADAHDVLLSIGSGRPVSTANRLRYTVPEFYIKTEAEVKGFFARYYGEAYAEELCLNTMYFADMCEEPDWIDPKYSNPSGKELPEFPVKDQPDYPEFLEYKARLPKDMPDDVGYLRYLCDKNFGRKVPEIKEEKYRDRLKEELEVIEYHGFSSYMLIVSDFIEYARRNGIRTGVGRGSVGGSLIGYLLNIHQADPIKYNLIFARFHNKEKTSYPDIDVDFDPAGRYQVQEYVTRKYGADRVADVSNVNTITPKVYARDVARACQFGGSQALAVKIGTELADSIPSDAGSIADAVKKSPAFARLTEKYPEVLQYAKHIEGKARSWGTHAGGVVVGRRSLVGLIPLRKTKDGNIAIEYEKTRAEENGLVKIDILGIATLGVVSDTYKLIAEQNKPLPDDPPDFDRYDKAAYDLISAGDTFGVFQLGKSGGTINLCKKIKPRSVVDLGLINALARPAAENIREDFVKVREGKAKMRLVHPSLERAFGHTYGFGLFEECLMYLAQDIAGWDLHKADGLRKLTKDKGKHPEKTAKLREEFISDARANGVNVRTASKIWDEVVDKFQGYGFNIPHATFYGMFGYHTAYLKAHFPLEFLTANLMNEVRSHAKQTAKFNIVKIRREIRKLGVKIIPPEINTSGSTYKIIDDKTLMTGLDALKYTGKDALPEIVAKRPFASLEDFLTKVNGSKVRSTAIQALAASGSLDSFGLSRKLIFLYAGDYKKKLQVWLKKDPSKRGDSFEYPWPNDVGEWTVREKFALEEFYLDEGLSGSVFDRYPLFFPDDSLDFSDIENKFPKPEEGKNAKTHVNIRGVVTDIFLFKVKKQTSRIVGRTMARAVLEDPWGNSIDLILFPAGLIDINEKLDSYSGGKQQLEAGLALYISGYINWYEGEVSFIYDNLIDFVSAPKKPPKEELAARSVKIVRAKKVKTKTKKVDRDKYLEEVEDELIDEGISTINDSTDIDRE